MRSEARVLLTGGAIVTSFDLLASVISRLSGHDYGNFAVGSYLIYLCVGVFASRLGVSSVAAGAFTGFVDASLGWWLASVIGPAMRHSSRPVTPGWWAFVAILVTVNAVFFSAIGSILESRLLYKFWPRSSVTD